MRNPNINRGTLPPGLYYLGDLTYLLNNEDYDEVMGKTENPRQSGIFINKKGQKFAIFSTMYGDGIYLDNNGDSYGVDSGTIGAYPIESFDEVNELGQGVEFIDEVNVDYDEEAGIISFGNIHIHTDPFDEVNDSN